MDPSYTKAAELLQRLSTPQPSAPPPLDRDGLMYRLPPPWDRDGLMHRLDGVEAVSRLIDEYGAVVVQRWLTHLAAEKGEALQ